ncbi:MAG: bifunctional phosphopantothenoylcysteine decarboxylase/phosphopantothenate--cysteine ligase CoaBC [Alphaproteobacteria bacterium]
MSLDGKRILLIIGGGIAAYKCLELIRRLQERGAAVRAILTAAGEQFVTPLSVGGLTGDKVYRDLFNLTDEAEMGHIQLSRDADLLVVAPATADLMAKMAGGFANDLASTALLATDKEVLIAPAMNVRMWEHAATRRNLHILREDGVHVVGPDAGPMACGEFGPGRMAEPAEIVAAIEDYFGAAGRPLEGRRALVTSGPTYEAIDPVRYIANRSSGKQGHAIAGALARLGAHTTLVSGPVSIPAPAGVHLVSVETAEEMLAACEEALPVDVAVCAAAVSDWRAGSPANRKLKKSVDGKPRIELVENPDILRELSAPGARRPGLVVGFAAETEKVIEHATVKRTRKGCDWMVANDVSPGTDVMGGEDNTVHLITEKGAESWQRMTKMQVAGRLAQAIAGHFAAAASARA